MTTNVRILLSDGKTGRIVTVKKLPPKRAVTITKTVRIDNLMLGVTARGTLYGLTYIPPSRGVHVGFTWSRLPVFARAFAELGVISEADRDATLAIYEKAHGEQKRQQDVWCLLQYAEELGIKLTKAQQRKLDT